MTDHSLSPDDPLQPHDHLLPDPAECHPVDGLVKRRRNDKPLPSVSKVMEDIRAGIPLITTEYVAVLMHKSKNSIDRMNALGHLPEPVFRGNRNYWDTEGFLTWMRGGEYPHGNRTPPPYNGRKPEV